MDSARSKFTDEYKRHAVELVTENEGAQRRRGAVAVVLFYVADGAYTPNVVGGFAPVRHIDIIF